MTVISDELSLENNLVSVPKEMLERVAKDAIERVHAPPRGVAPWFKFMFGSQPRAPSYWTKFIERRSLKDWMMETSVGNQTSHLVNVPSDMFHAIDSLVQDTWVTDKVGHGRDAHGLGNLNYTHVKVTDVKRIENCALFYQYCLERQKLFKHGMKKGVLSAIENVKGSSGKLMTTSRIGSDSVLSKDIYSEINEHYLFHGTAVAERIAKQGLDTRLGGQNAMFGQGVYCAESSTKSDQYAGRPTFNYLKGNIYAFY